MLHLFLLPWDPVSGLWVLVLQGLRSPGLGGRGLDLGLRWAVSLDRGVGIRWRGHSEGHEFGGLAFTGLLFVSVVLLGDLLYLHTQESSFQILIFLGIFFLPILFQVHMVRDGLFPIQGAHSSESDHCIEAIADLGAETRHYRDPEHGFCGVVGSWAGSESVSPSFGGPVEVLAHRFSGFSF